MIHCTKKTAIDIDISQSVSYIISCQILKKLKIVYFINFVNRIS